MPKALTILGMIVACLMILLFGVDAAVGIPFQKASMTFDILVIVGACMLGFISWSSYREQK